MKPFVDSIIVQVVIGTLGEDGMARKFPMQPAHMNNKADLEHIPQLIDAGLAEVAKQQAPKKAPPKKAPRKKKR